MEQAKVSQVTVHKNPRFTFEVNFDIWFGNSILIATIGVLISVNIDKILGSLYIILACVLHSWTLFWFVYLSRRMEDKKRGVMIQLRSHSHIRVFPLVLLLILLGQFGLFIATVVMILK
jgi:hypothetical protein